MCYIVSVTNVCVYILQYSVLYAGFLPPISMDSSIYKYTYIK